MLRHLPRETFFRAGLDLRSGRREFLQPVLAPRQFFRDRHPVRHVRLIRRFGFRQQFGHFGLQLRLDLAGVLIDNALWRLALA